MRLSEAPVVDVRGPLTAQRGRLLSLLVWLSDAQWAASTAAPPWAVKDIGLHLLDVDLSWLARGRDHYGTGMIPVPADHDEFVRGLAQRNERWVDGTRSLSPRLLTGAHYDARQVQLSGDPALAGPLLRVRGIIV